MTRSCSTDSASTPTRSDRVWPRLLRMAMIALARRRPARACDRTVSGTAPRSVLPWAVLALLLVLGPAGCGGGVGTGGTGTFASGPITGFGSIVVNGVHFDESAARIEDEDGQAVGSAVLQLGVTVQVEAGPVSTDSSGAAVASATRVRYQREIVGSATLVNAAAGTLTVLGQPVVVTTNTVFDDGLKGGLASLRLGSVVEVYGDYDAARSRYVATRVALAGAGSGNRLKGLVNGLDSTAMTFRIGDQTYSYASLTTTPGLGNGSEVALKVSDMHDAEGRWVVSGQHGPDGTPDNADKVELRGRVSAVLAGGRFVVDGVTVDSSALQVNVTPGIQVEVSGALRAGTLVAAKVSVEGGDEPQSYELRGSVGSVDTVVKRFVLRNPMHDTMRDTTVSFARADLKYKDGTQDDLVKDALVEVEGVLAADGVTLDATSIRFRK